MELKNPLGIENYYNHRPNWYNVPVCFLVFSRPLNSYIINHKILAFRYLGLILYTSYQ